MPVKKRYRKSANAWEATPKGKYLRQMARAKARGVEWQFTFETWWAVWYKSGLWFKRGRGKGMYCMGRRGDIGPYHPDNVEIIPYTFNSYQSLKTAGLLDEDNVSF